MKKQCSYAILALIPLACKNPSPQASFPSPVSTRQAINILDPHQQSDLLNKTLRSFRQAAQKFVVSTGSRHQLIGKKGTIIELQADDLETTDGSPLGKQIDVALLELQDQNDFLKNTITTTSNGRLLVSGGAYYINCTSAGKVLRIKKGKTIAVSIPKLTDEKMNLFYGETLADGGVNWRPSKKSITDKLTKDSVWANVPKLMAKDTVYGSDWRTRYEPTNTVLNENGEPAPDTVPVLNNVLTYVLDTEYHRERVAVTPKVVEEGYEQIELAQLGWINCDRFYDAEKTQLAINLPVLEQRGVVIKTFIVCQSLNSVSEHDFTTSEQNNHVVISGLPANQPVRITSVAYYDGKVHTFTKEVRLKPHTHVDMQMQPSDAAEISRLFDSGVKS